MTEICISGFKSVRVRNFLLNHSRNAGLAVKPGVLPDLNGDIVSGVDASVTGIDVKKRSNKN